MVGFSPRFSQGPGDASREVDLTAEECFHAACAQRGSCVRSERTTCCDPTVRSMLLIYSLKICEEEEAVAFEAHLLDCEVCYRDLRALDRAGAVIRQIAEIEPARREGAREGESAGSGSGCSACRTAGRTVPSPLTPPQA